MNKRLILLLFLGAMCTTLMAQRHTDQLDRGLVAIPTGSTSGSTTNLVTWRRLTTEYYDVKYNVYKNGSKVASNLTSTCFADNSNAPSTTQYQVAAVVNGKEQAKCTAVTPWKQYVYKLGNNRYPTSYIDIPLAIVNDRDGNDVTSHYEPNDAEMADLDGDGQLEIIIKRLNTADASSTGSPTGEYQKDENGNYILDENDEKIPIYDGGVYSAGSKEFVVIDAYDVNWQTGAATLMWRIDCGSNMVSLNSTEIDIIAYDWDEDGKAEIVLRGADDMVIHMSDGTTQTVGIAGFNFRNSPYFDHNNGWQYAWSHFGREYLIYMNGVTGKPYQITDFPLPRLEQSEWPSGIAYNDYVALLNNSSKAAEYFKKNSGTLHKAWGDHYGHRSTKFFFGAPFLDGRKASLFLGRGIYTRHKMIAMDLDRDSHEWRERWRWNCNNSSSPWYGNGYHNYVIADVDEDGRDEIVYGSMVIDDNGKGLSTTGLRHGDAQHVSDFDPYRKGLEFFGCNEDKPGMNYRNATTSELYVRVTAAKDDGRGLMANFSNEYPGSVGRSVSSGLYSSVNDKEINSLSSFIAWGDLNYRIYWDGDLCSEILNSPGTAREAKVEKPGTGRLFTSSGCNMNNDSKNNPCFQGDIIGDWREEIVVRCGTNLRVYTSGIYTGYSLPTLWNDHQYRQAMVWQMMAYNQPPHLSYFLGEMEGITTAPPTLTNDGRTEVANGSTITTTSDHLLMAETNDMTVSVEDGASPYILTVNTPTWVQGNDNNNNITTTTYTHTLTGGAFTGKMRLVKQGDGVLVLPDVTETYSGETNVWAGTLRFNATMEKSPVWLNRFTTLETDGGTFNKGITADYGATIVVGNEGISVSNLTLNHGARLLIDIDADGTVTPVNVTKLTLNTKSGEVWEQYGPKYLKPIVEFTLSGSLYSGKYYMGDVGSVTGNIENDILLEGLDGITTPHLSVEDGKLYLVVGSGESIDCPEATFAVCGYQQTNDGLLPIVSIDPGTFSYGGSEVTPNVTATFNGEEVEMLTLYSEDYEQATDVSGWINSGAPISIATGDSEHGNYFFVNLGSTNTRYAYTRLSNVDVSQCSKYAIEFDLALKWGNTDPTEFCVMSKGGTNPSNKWDNYAAINEYKNMLFDITAPKYSTTYTVNGTETTTTLDADTWYHFTLEVDCTAGTVAWSISNGDKGTFTFPEGTSSEVDGFYLVAGRSYSAIKLDNIRIYRTDGYYFTFNELGTLTVTTSYPGCQSATATYAATEYVKIGDANNDGQVNIVDVAVTISYLTGQKPESFIKEAADIDGNGTVNQTDLDEIVKRIGW